MSTNCSGELFCVAPIARWAIWDTHSGSSGPPTSAELNFIEPMLRRRLSTLARMSLKVAHDCAHDLPSARFVYASRHGDLNRTTAMLDDLAAGESLSPTAFTMSVLNASPGLFSILRHDMAPTTAVSAAADSFVYGLLEACLQLTENPESPVVIVYADEPVPTVYEHIEPQDSNAHAIGLLLKCGAPITIGCASIPGDQVVSREPQSRAFLRCLEGAITSAWSSGDKSWIWTRQAH